MVEKLKPREEVDNTLRIHGPSQAWRGSDLLESCGPQVSSCSLPFLFCTFPLAPALALAVPAAQKYTTLTCHETPHTYTSGPHNLLPLLRPHSPAGLASGVFACALFCFPSLPVCQMLQEVPPTSPALFTSPDTETQPPLHAQSAVLALHFEPIEEEVRHGTPVC